MGMGMFIHSTGDRQRDGADAYANALKRKVRIR
jgi:hypothetical protein